MQKPSGAISERKRAVESQTISLRPIDIRSETGSSQCARGVCAREKSCRSRFLDCDIETKHGCILLTKDSEDYARSVDDRDRDARVTAEWLADRCARDVCLLRGVRDYRADFIGAK